MPSSFLLLQSPGFKTDSTSALLIYFQTHRILDALPTAPLKMLHVKMTFMLESKVLILLDLCNNLTLWYNLLLEFPLDGTFPSGSTLPLLPKLSPWSSPEILFQTSSHCTHS